MSPRLYDQLAAPDPEPADDPDEEPSHPDETPDDDT